MRANAATTARPSPEIAEDDQSPTHWSYVDRGEVERFLTILGAMPKPSGQTRRRGRPRREQVAGQRKIGRRKSSGMGKD
jgi:hypothetical protein